MPMQKLAERMDAPASVEDSVSDFLTWIQGQYDEALQTADCAPRSRFRLVSPPAAGASTRKLGPFKGPIANTCYYFTVRVMAALHADAELSEGLVVVTDLGGTVRMPPALEKWVTIRPMVENGGAGFYVEFTASDYLYADFDITVPHNTDPR